MKKVNRYFFDSDQVSLSDALFFYGSITFITLFGIIFVINLLFF